MSQTEKRNLERVQNWQGQMLRSRDFNDIHAVEEQRRWWHNRALHNAYGIHQASDTSAAFFPSPNHDNTAAVVTAGLAYDSFGRELILEADQTIPYPPITQQDQEFLLLARYRMKSPDVCAEDVSGACFTNSGPLSPRFVEFIWKHKHQCSFTDGVPLADLNIRSGEPSFTPITQPSARALARPQLGSGSTVAGNTPWELWTDGFESEPTVFGVQTTIDTSASGFTDAPCYFAWLQGNFLNQQTGQLLPALFTSIAEESVNGFVFRIALPELQSQFSVVAPPSTYVSPDDFVLFSRKQNLYVNWVGCQENASAPFFFTLFLNPLILDNPNLLRFRPSLNLSILEGVVSRLNKL